MGIDVVPTVMSSIYIAPFVVIVCREGLVFFGRISFHFISRLSHFYFTVLI